jgi:uncharacterized membrane protein YhiD involved in acid resistance
VRLAHDISAGAASRRAFLADVLAAALFAFVAILFAAGIGVVGFGALGVLLVLSIWIAVEILVRSITRRHRRKEAAPPPRATHNMTP